MKRMFLKNYKKKEKWRGCFKNWTKKRKRKWRGCLKKKRKLNLKKGRKWKGLLNKEIEKIFEQGKTNCLKKKERKILRFLSSLFFFRNIQLRKNYCSFWSVSMRLTLFSWLSNFNFLITYFTLALKKTRCLPPSPINLFVQLIELQSNLHLHLLRIG